MNDNHETIADIIAEKRALADRMEHEMAVAKECKEPIAHRTAQAIIDGTRREADRIEAAYKREQGDCAKLREALEKVAASAEYAIEQDDLDRGDLLGFVEEMGQDARAALAEPPRNCDKYATADEALKAQEQMFNDSNFANGECKLGCPECDNPRVGCKIAWLFAPATEKEGGKNAD